MRCRMSGPAAQMSSRPTFNIPTWGASCRRERVGTIGLRHVQRHDERVLGPRDHAVAGSTSYSGRHAETTAQVRG